MSVIKSVKFQSNDHRPPSKRRYGDREAVATMSDGNKDVYVMCWFSDELRFWEEELIGLTIEEARNLKQARDIAYLRS